jgi:hypothetical protein
MITRVMRAIRMTVMRAVRISGAGKYLPDKPTQGSQKRVSGYVVVRGNGGTCFRLVSDSRDQHKATVMSRGAQRAKHRICEPAGDVRW